MFLEEMEQILCGVPYLVWEQVIGAEVEQVAVQRMGLPFAGTKNTGMPIRVVITSGIHEHVLEGLDMVEAPNKELLCLWKPYRELIERTLKESMKALEENPPKYIFPPVTEREFDDRIRRIKNGEGRLQLGAYIFRFHLTNDLKEICFSQDISPEEAETAIKDAAFDLILETVKKEKADLVKSENPVGRTFELTEDNRDAFAELIGYLEDIMDTDWNEERLSRKLETFLYQDRSIRELYLEAEAVLDDVFSELSERKKEYYRLTKMDQRVKKRVLSMKDERIRSSWTENGKNPFARGYLEGVFYGFMKTLYDLCAAKEGWEDVRKSFLAGNPDIETVLHAIEETVEDYRNAERPSFEAVEPEIFFYELETSGGKTIVIGELQQYGIHGKGADKAEVISKIKDGFEMQQELARIDRILKLD